MTPPLSYRLLKQYVRLGLMIYFKKWQSHNVHNIPAEGPFIFVANHQNAFLDALLVVCGIKRNPWFIARGDVFKKPWIVRLLTFMRIKPLFRFRDGHASMRKNDRIINECLSLLKAGECILIFGEGDHNQPWTFRDMKRGFAHLALQYMEKTQQDIMVVPVGLHYEVHDKFRSRVLVNYGEPISILELTRAIPDSREKFPPLLAYTAKKMKSLILTIPLDENYEARKNFLLQNRIKKRDMVEQLEADRQLMDSWKKSDENTGSRPSIYNWFNPLYLYGRLAHAIPEIIIEYVATKKIKDDQFVGSIKLAVGIFLIPVYYLMLVILFFLSTGQPLWTVGFFISLPVSGLFAYDK